MFSTNNSSSVNEERHQTEDGYPRRPFVTDSAARSMSLDSRDEFSIPHDQPMFDHKMQPSPNSPQVHHANMEYQRFPPIYRRLPSRHLHSVVTSSFSIDEERDDTPRGYMRGREHTREPRVDNDERRHDGDECNGWNTGTTGGAGYFVPTTPSPKCSAMSSHPFLQRSYSTSGYFAQSEAMKRSYYHHSLPPNHQYPGHLPPEFMPPTKRTRHEPIRKEIIVSPRDESHPETGRVVHRAHSFPAPPSWVATHYQPRSSQHPPPTSSPHHQASSPMAFMGSNHGVPEQYAQVSPASEVDESPRSWRSDPSWNPSSYPRQTGSHFWESPRNNDVDCSTRQKSAYHTADFSPRVSHDEDSKPAARSSTGDEKMRMMVEAAAAANSALSDNALSEKASTSLSHTGMLLALPDDRVSLSETLCVVRENIEVFTATQSDVDAPAPGRKHAVAVGQVGLRCIHCSHTTRCSDRVKRAVCYPSSIKRIYRTVIDMKLDHFSQCKFVPVTLKNHLDELKAIHTRSTGTTMQYFIQAAHSLGMADGPAGVVLSESKGAKPTPTRLAVQEQRDIPAPPERSDSAIVTRCDSLSSGSWTSGNIDAGAHPKIDSMASWSFEAPAGARATSQNTAGNSDHNFEGLIPLSLSEDKTALSPLRCFLREQVCAFSATEKDIAVRAPTTFSISVGQVGIGCIHCVKQSARNRSNRAVCFPFSIGRIYQSVADIQRFHFGECKMMPTEVKDKFLELQSASSKGSKGLATRQYWVTSAKKIGLVDTATGIRFGRDPSKPESTAAFSLDILAQVAFSVTTASKPLVSPEDKPCIAEFLYVVMEQLQPCRFTEADRNKRRLKDVGCIGVECKHCAGQVDSRKFFWSSVSAVESNFVSVHTHVLECKSVPDSLKERLIELKQLRKEQTAALRTGSQKSFFARVWQRLHESDSSDDSMPSSQFRELNNAQISSQQHREACTSQEIVSI